MIRELVVLTHTRSLADQQVSVFVISLPFHQQWMNEICNYLAGPSSNLDGNKRNLYSSLMSTEHCCSHLIRDLIVIIMKKYTQLLLEWSCKHSAN